MALNNASNFIQHLSPFGAAYAGSTKEIDTVLLGQGQYLGGNVTGGNASAPTAWTIVGGANGITVDSSTTPGKTLINGPTPPTPGMTSNTASSNTTMVKKNSYIATGTTSLTFTLPSNAVAGDPYEIIGSGPLGAPFVIQAAAGQVIFLGDTSTAAGGTVTSKLPSDSAYIYCVGTNTFSVKSSTGNFDIV
jgi:hypothetical protein